MQGGTARSSLSVRPGHKSALSRWPEALAGLTLLISTSPVFAFDTAVFATADSYVKGGQPNQNQGGEAILRIQDSGDNRTLVRFDQAAIANAVGSGHLTQAKLRLNIDFNGNNWGPNGRAVAVHRMVQDWTELGATWNCPDDTNTANGSPDCTPWVMNDSSRYPFLVTPTDVIAHMNNQLGAVEWDVTADVQAFLASAPNYGWLIKKADESESGRVDYSSREGTVVPELVLTIDGPTLPAKPKLLDTFIRQGAPNKSLGSELYLRIQDSGNNRTLVAFDQAELEHKVGSQTLSSAKLRLTIISNADNWGPTGREVAVHRMLQGWTEVGATWNCADDLNTENGSPDCPAASWDMTHSTNWPFDPNSTATAPHNNGQTGAVEWDVTADVQAFLAGTAINYGWVVKKVDEGQAGQVEYSSREGASPPELVLELNATPPPPPPLTLAVTGPADGSATAESSIAVSGSFEGPLNTGITVNGVPAMTFGNQFFINLDLVPGVNTLTVVATTLDGTTVTKTVNVTTTASAPDPIQVKAEPQGGVAPLPVQFSVTNNSTLGIASIDVDFDGNGTTDFSTTDPAAPVASTYASPGVYLAAVRITDSQGLVHAKTLYIVVNDPAHMDVLFENMWSGMNQALIGGDFNAALTYLNESAKRKYQPVFEALKPHFADIIASYSPLSRVSISSDIGEYAIVRPNNGQNQLYLIYFLRDVDGVWRVDAM
jgi:Glucodextranase, domain B